jgi:hypothetical protein
MVALNMQLQEELDQLKEEQQGKLVRPATLKEMAKINQGVK